MKARNVVKQGSFWLEKKSNTKKIKNAIKIKMLDSSMITYDKYNLSHNGNVEQKA